MLPQANRIRRKKDFEAVFKNSKNFKNSFFILKVSKNSLGLNRFGFVVSQKVSKKATVRNKIRRRLSEAVKGVVGLSENGMDAVLIALPNIAKKEFSEIKPVVDTEIVRAKISAKPDVKTKK